MMVEWVKDVVGLVKKLVYIKTTISTFGAYPLVFE